MYAKLLRSRKNFRLEDNSGHVYAIGTREHVEAVAKARSISVLYPAWGPNGQTVWVTIPPR